MKPYATPALAKEALRKWAVRASGGCDLHNGWPCGTCMHCAASRIGGTDWGKLHSILTSIAQGKPNERWVT